MLTDACPTFSAWDQFEDINTLLCLTVITIFCVFSGHPKTFDGHPPLFKKQKQSYSREQILILLWTWRTSLWLLRTAPPPSSCRRCIPAWRPGRPPPLCQSPPQHRLLRPRKLHKRGRNRYRQHLTQRSTMSKEHTVLLPFNVVVRSETTVLKLQSKWQFKMTDNFFLNSRWFIISFTLPAWKNKINYSEIHKVFLMDTCNAYFWPKTQVL